MATFSSALLMVLPTHKSLLRTTLSTLTYLRQGVDEVLRMVNLHTVGVVLIGDDAKSCKTTQSEGEGFVIFFEAFTSYRMLHPSQASLLRISLG